MTCDAPPDASSPADFDQAIRHTAELLEAIAEDRRLLAGIDDALRERLLIAAGQVSRPDKMALRQLARAKRRRAHDDQRNADQALLDQSQIRILRENPIYLTPRMAPGRADSPGTAPAAPTAPGPSAPIGILQEPRICYICRQKYTHVHFFYDQLCISCGDLNHEKRNQSENLLDRTALVTGARVKIGYQAAIMLLRAGCHVICTTRFPKDAARRYAAEADFGSWSDRLEIHGVDLRHTPSVEALCRALGERHRRLDYVLNNACQTVRRPPGFYDHLMQLELGDGAPLSGRERALLAPPLPGLVPSPSSGVPPVALPAALSQVTLLAEDLQRGASLFPEGQLDADLQQVDLRTVNSWRLKMADVSAVELIEVHLVNAVAPYIINARLKPLMMAVPTRDAHIVNVSAMEGQFYRTTKSDKHPHTNMAKAALNMMTRTAALDYIQHGIHMNSVDTGWVTDEDPVEHARRKREVHRFHPPLDIVDGAARICDPIFAGLRTGVHVWGQFLKDYHPTDW